MTLFFYWCGWLGCGLMWSNLGVFGLGWVGGCGAGSGYEDIKINIGLVVGGWWLVSIC